MAKKVAGIDEAGRGPALGPLVVAIAAADEAAIAELESLGVKDSKLLAPRVRERLSEEIQKLCEVKLIILSPEEIDAAVESDNTNLNWLEADTSVKLVSQAKPDKVIIDCPSNNIKAYCSYIKEKIKIKDMEIVCEHKADLNNTIVGAASIVAKVARDAEVEKIKKKIGIDFGSGYPSDPKTQEFLRKFWNRKEYSQYFRKSWDCWKRIGKEKEQKKIGEY
ncbi:MAG: ribonuclease HII [Candidatus Woesearchaeota archaeon]